MSNPFHSPKRRIARAKKHISDLDRRIKKFFKKEPYVRLVEPDTDGIHLLHKVKLTKAVPDGFTDLAYDAIDQLRSALDQSTYPIAVACGAKHVDRVHFPIADTATDFENALAGNCKELPLDILALLRGFKPYKGGNDIIWALNRIRRQGYHRLLVPVGTSTTGIHIRRMTISGDFSIPTPQWDGKKNEMIFFRTALNTEVNYNLDFTFFIAFGDVEGVAGQPVIPFLNAAVSEVEGIFLAIEAEAARIGLLP